MAVGLLYRANAPFPKPLGSIQHSHQRSDMCLMRVQEICPLSFAVWGQTRPLAPALCLFQVDICSTLLHLFMYPVTLCVLRHRYDLLTLLVVSRCSDGSPPFLVLRGRIRIQPQ